MIISSRVRAKFQLKINLSEIRLIEKRKLEIEKDKVCINVKGNEKRQELKAGDN